MLGFILPIYLHKAQCNIHLVTVYNMSCFLALMVMICNKMAKKAAHNYVRLIQYEHYEVQTKSREKNS